jgi:hypothetical protein
MFAVLGFCGLILSLLLLRADRRRALPHAASRRPVPRTAALAVRGPVAEREQGT